MKNWTAERQRLQDAESPVIMSDRKASSVKWSLTESPLAAHRQFFAIVLRKRSAS